MEPYQDKKPIIMDRQGKPVVAKTQGQAGFIKAVEGHDITLALGPAGTGKTYLAAAIAVSYLQSERVNKIILVRPAVESGENLGYLPGDLREKIAPYMAPLTDSLEDLLPTSVLTKMRSEGVLEIAPLAYMRGRTLNNCFILLDEAQNTTVSQMKMFLTRIGIGSKVIVSGDSTQQDLPKGKISGLNHAFKILKNIKGIARYQLTVNDVVRHKIVKEIIQAYDDTTVSTP